MPKLKKIPLEQIRSTPQNPRSERSARSAEDLAEAALAPNSGEELRGLAASLGTEQEARLVGPPAVEELGPEEYRILAGERRIRAARLAGWKTIPCLVYPLLDPAQAHTLRLLENLHRRALHPLDQAASLKIAWLAANGEALELQTQVGEILGIEQTPAQTLSALQTLLEANQFKPTYPPVSWDTLLDQLGVEMTPARRKRLLSVLGVDSTVQARVRALEISEASLRALGQLEAADQAKLVEAIEAEPELARKVRRIAHAVNNQDYQLEEALNEAQGQVVLDDFSEAGPGRPAEAEVEENEDLENREDQPMDEGLLMDTVVALMEMADQLGNTLEALHQIAQGGPWTDLPEPWGAYAQEAYQKIKTQIERGNPDVM